MTTAEEILLSIYGWGAFCFLFAGWLATRADVHKSLKVIGAISAAYVWPVLLPIIAAVAFVRFSNEGDTPKQPEAAGPKVGAVSVTKAAPLRQLETWMFRQMRAIKASGNEERAQAFIDVLRHISVLQGREASGSPTNQKEGG